MLRDAKAVYRSGGDVQDWIKHMARLARSVGYAMTLNEEPEPVPLRVYVNDGRLVGDCVCGNGIVPWRDYSRAWCVECGRCWSVLLPERLDEIESLLLSRRWARHRNWNLDEPVANLALENRALEDALTRNLMLDEGRAVIDTGIERRPV